MNIREFLALFPDHQGFSRKSLVLLFAYYLRKYRGKTQFSANDIRDCFKAAMLRLPTDLGVLLRRLSTGRGSPFIRATRRGSYGLSARGLSEVEAIIPETPATPADLGSFLQAGVPYLRKVVAKVTDAQRQEFLAEAIACVGVGARRATVVMTWLVALDHLYEYVVKHHLAGFNTALSKRSDKLAKLVVSTRDDFGEMKEAQFIEICRSAKVFTSDVRKLLDEKLGFRNSCAHPSSIKLGDAKVVSFIEDLVENVMVRYQI